MNFFKINDQPCISGMENAVLYISDSKLCMKMIFQKFVLAVGKSRVTLRRRHFAAAKTNYCRSSAPLIVLSAPYVKCTQYECIDVTLDDQNHN